MNKRSFRLKFAFSLAIMSDGLLRETNCLWNCLDEYLFLFLFRRVSQDKHVDKRS